MNHKFIFGLILLISLSFSGCMGDLSSELTDDEIGFIKTAQQEYMKENISKPYNKINVQAVQKDDNYISVTGTVEIYNKTDYPFTPITKIDIEYGVGKIVFNETNYSVYSHTNYYTVFNGKTDFYDKWYSDLEYAQLPHHIITDDAISINLQFNDIVKVGSFYPVEHQTVNLNNQISVVFDIGVSGPHASIKNPVLCFVNDYSTPFEGDEFLRYNNQQQQPSVTLTLISGADFDAQVDITDSISHGECISLNRHDGTDGRWIDGGWLARYQIDFNFIRFDHLRTTDIMEVYLDDLDSYRGRDIMLNTKAEPVHIATITG